VSGVTYRRLVPASALATKTYYRVTVRVTKWRSYTINSARVTYTYRHRI
jgi:hypothetical protein